MAKLGLKLAKGEKIGASCEEGYMPNGIRVNLFEKERGAKRAVNMLIAKINGKPFTTEYPMPDFDRVAPNPAVKDIAHAKIALVTSGGIVPKGNPDHIESSNATHYGKYDIEGVMDLTSDRYATAHGGYDPVYANADADRVRRWTCCGSLRKRVKSAPCTGISTPPLATALQLRAPRLSLLSSPRSSSRTVFRP